MIAERKDNDDTSQIARWLSRQQSGESTSAEMRQFNEWLAQSDARRRIYEEFESALAVADEAGNDLLAGQFARELEAEYESSLARRAGRFWPAIAASVVLVIGASVAFYGVFMRADGSQQFATEVGERRGVVLEDGSSARLNTNSAVTVSYTSGERHVELKNGEAFFEVRRDPDRPFVVRTRYADITVTGTAFDVQSFDSYVNLSVISGSVTVDAQGFAGAHALGAGDNFRIFANGAVEFGRFDEAVALSWLLGVARYQDTPLREVVADLNRYFPKPITVSDAAIGELPVTGEFDLSDQATAVKALSVAFDLVAVAGVDAIALRPAAPAGE